MIDPDRRRPPSRAASSTITHPPLTIVAKTLVTGEGGVYTSHRHLRHPGAVLTYQVSDVEDLAGDAALVHPTVRCSPQGPEGRATDSRLPSR